MTTHEGHDHPATKAGRAACRRDRGEMKRHDSRTADIASRLRDKATKATKGKTRVKPDTAEGDAPRKVPAYRGLGGSGLCGEGSHNRCTGFAITTPCACPCHAIA